MRLLRWAVFLGVVGGAAGLWLSRPQPLEAAVLDGIIGDAAAGAVTFAVAGCASCHVASDAESGVAPVLSGGQRFVTAFGTFVAPNISPDPVHGVGAWSDLEIASAIMTGVSPGGQHYYPAFPYASYARATPQDVADIVAYLRTLLASDVPSADSEVGFPFNIRRGVGLWKALYVAPDWVIAEAATDEIARGRYLVEALGHCAECHTPRDALGGLDTSRWLAGAVAPDGEGRVPGITPAILDWSERDIAAYLSSGFTPDFDSAGGEMAAVVRNTAQLSDADRLAIAAYLKALPEEAPATP